MNKSTLALWSSRWPTLVLLSLVILIQYPLWLGKGGWLRASDLEKQLKVQQLKNRQMVARNEALGGEIRDLKTGSVAVEERARNEHDLIRKGELFVQFNNLPVQTITQTPVPSTTQIQVK